MSDAINVLKSKKGIIGLIGIAVIVAIVWWAWSKGKSASIAYREASVERGDLEMTILSTGVVAPENRLEIKPPIAGRVETVLIKEGQEVKKGQVLAWMSSTERAALLDAARARGPEELKRWEAFYKATPILAPIDGTIILRTIEPGQTFTNQESVMVMSDRLTIKAQVDETDIAQICLKQEARVVLDAYANQPLPAHVDQIAYDATTVNNVTIYIVDVLPDKAPEFMRSGMTANVSFFVASRPKILLVPVEAIKVKDGRSVVLSMSKSRREKPVEKMVEVGVTDGKKTEIVSGLNEGDVVLVPQLTSKGGPGAPSSNPFTPLGGRRH